jgi:hypothetical protein
VKGIKKGRSENHMTDKLCDDLVPEERIDPRIMTTIEDTVVLGNEPNSPPLRPYSLNRSPTLLWRNCGRKPELITLMFGRGWHVRRATMSPSRLVDHRER